MTIPKIIHICWFGDSAPSSQLQTCAASRQILVDAGYTILVWNEGNYDFSTPTSLAAAYKAKKWSLVSNYVRLDVLAKHGGIYIDTDVEILKPFDDLLSFELFIGFMWDCTLGTAVIGAAPHNHIICSIKAMYDNDASSLISPNNNTFTDYFLEHMNGFVLNGKSQINDKTVILSKQYFEHPSLFLGRNYTVHHFNQSWKNQSVLKEVSKSIAIRVLSLFIYRKYVCWRSKKISRYYRIFKLHRQLPYKSYGLDQ